MWREQYNQAVKERGREQSYFTISESEAKKYVYQYAGLGITDAEDPAKVPWYEFVDVDKSIGKYFEGGEWHKTHRIQNIYSKKGVHIVPVKER